MTFEEIDERYRDAALDDDKGDGWDDPTEAPGDEADADELETGQDDDA